MSAAGTPAAIILAANVLSELLPVAQLATTVLTNFHKDGSLPTPEQTATLKGWSSDELTEFKSDLPPDQSPAAPAVG